MSCDSTEYENKKLRGSSLKQRFPDCDFPLTGIDDFVEFIKNRLSNRIPTSFVRIGDGEGVILARPTPREVILFTHAKDQFGPHITVRLIHSLADMLSSAIISADVVGIRDDFLNVSFSPDNFNLSSDQFMQQFKSSFPLRKVDIQGLKYQGAIRLARTQQIISKLEFCSDTIFVSAWLHFIMSSNGALVRMIRKQERIGLISSKPVLARELREKLNVDVDFYDIPDFYQVAVHNGCNRIHYPDEFKKNLEALKVTIPGQLFLVGAGICGKIYCQRVKELGGIAMDIGAVCDTWINIPSRRAVLVDMFGRSDGTVPESLLLEFQANRF